MEAFVQMTGYVGGEVTYRNNGIPVADFRLASTPRMQRGNEWANGETTWITVKAFRSLAEHLASSLHRGDPVLVIGKLRTTVWTRDGVTYERLELDATTVGHDLRRGTSSFRRALRPNVGDEGAYDAGHSAGGDALDPQALNPGVEQPPADQPSAEQPSVEQPSVEQPSVEQPSVEQPSVEQPSVDRRPGDRLGSEAA